jgi:hypothetical protein
MGDNPANLFADGYTTAVKGGTRLAMMFRYPVAFKHCSTFIKGPNVCPENTP